MLLLVEHSDPYLRSELSVNARLIQSQTVVKTAEVQPDTFCPSYAYQSLGEDFTDFFEDFVLVGF